MRGGKSQRQAVRRWSIALFVVLAATTLARAERLPIKVYTTADGLPSSYVLRVVPDSRGFLWFCTRDGLSRFDGRSFVNYTVENGLPDPTINNLLETRSGVYWVATNGGGACRFNPNPRASEDDQPWSDTRLFTVFPVGDGPASNRVNVLCEDRAGRLWAGTDDGLFLLEETGGQMAFRRFDVGLQQPVMVSSLLEDREGNLWMGLRTGLLRRLPDGGTLHKALRPSQLLDRVRGLFEDTGGELWVAHDAGLLVLRPGPANEFANADLRLAAYKSKLPRSSSIGNFRWFTTEDGLPRDSTTALHRSSEGRLWIATPGGLALFDGNRFQSYTTAQGLADNTITSLAEDKDGNLWIGSVAGGAMKLALNALTSFDETDGLTQTPALRGPAMFEDRAGNLCVLSLSRTINRFDGERFTVVRPRAEWDSEDESGILGGLVDHLGQYWLLIGRRLFRFPGVSRIEDLAREQPAASYTQRDWGRGEYVYDFFEDSRGDIWVGTSGTQTGLARWERATEQWYSYPLPDGLPPRSFASALSEDKSGAVWIGFYYGGVARYSEGRFTVFTAEDGLPAGGITELHCDRVGRLWISTNQGGVGRIDDPLAARPECKLYTTAQGLSSINARCIAEDSWGRVYIGTARGVDQLDVETGQVRHFSTSDGLASDFVSSAFRDRSGALWFGSRRGLSRLVPQQDTVSPAPPPVWVGSLRVAGVLQSVSQLGERELSGLQLQPDQNQIQIEFFGLGFRTGETLRYQFMLEGADADWSSPSADRTVNYASLRPGKYRFLVRALGTEGTASASPAVISFRILHPVWQRWWFLTIAVSMIGGAIYALYRYRVGHLISLERVRTRIATDLHDDIGASLSRIAIMSEVVKQQAPDQTSTQRLTEIADTARELVDSMSEIVWSIDPRHDDLRSVVVHVRQFASDVLESRGINFSLQVSSDVERVRVAPEQRRHLFMILKEAVNNIARHAHCASVSLAISTSNNQLVAEVRDDGCGFELSRPAQIPTNRRGGHGIKNMQTRAAHLNGQLDVRTSPGNGTCLLLTVPLKELGA